MQNRAPIDIKVLAGRADNESPIHIGSISTLGKLKKGAASIRLLSLSHSERKKKALLCLLPSSLIESKTHTSAYESYGFLTFSGNRFSPVLAGPCSNNILLVHYHLRSSAIRMLPTTRLRLMICIAVASGPRRELSLGISSVYTDSLTAIDEGMVRLSFPDAKRGIFYRASQVRVSSAVSLKGDEKFT